MSDIVILSVARTPIGSFQGVLASQPAPRIGAAAITSAVTRAGLAPVDVPAVLMGNVLQAGQVQAPARQAAIHAGLPASARCATITRCAAPACRR